MKVHWCHVIPGDMVISDRSIAVSSAKYVTVRYADQVIPSNPRVSITWLIRNGQAHTMSHAAYDEVEIERFE